MHSGEIIGNLKTGGLGKTVTKEVTEWDTPADFEGEAIIKTSQGDVRIQICPFEWRVKDSSDFPKVEPLTNYPIFCA